MSTATLQHFATLDADACADHIRHSKAALGSDVVVLGHHYQRDEVIQHADHSGDSLKLALLASRSQARHIVFCGVHFMAEVADILSSDDQTAILPDLAAGCSMADMANLKAVQRCWDELSSLLDADACITPITYINSAADLKAFCGARNGFVCTSSNAASVLGQALKEREKVLFFPDQHLGENTALAMGMSADDLAIWDFSQPMGGLSPSQITRARILLWKGFCSVHQMFHTEQIDSFRAQHPDGQVIAHPECSAAVCQASDLTGSTEVIINTLRAAPDNSHWLVGTELNLVNRLREELAPRGIEVRFMASTLCMCSTMFRTSPQHLAWVLDNLVQGKVVNRIQVDTHTSTLARKALQRMFAHTAA